MTSRMKPTCLSGTLATASRDGGILDPLHGAAPIGFHQPSLSYLGSSRHKPPGRLGHSSAPVSHASLTSRSSLSSPSTSGAAVGHTDPRRTAESPVVHADPEAATPSPRPALPPAPARDHDAAPDRPGKPGELPGPVQRSRPYGRRSTGSRGKGVQGLSKVRHLGPRICQGSVL